MTSVYLTIWGWVTNTLLKLALSTAPSHAVHLSHQWIIVNYSITACMVTNVTDMLLLPNLSITTTLQPCDMVKQWCLPFAMTSNSMLTLICSGVKQHKFAQWCFRLGDLRCTALYKVWMFSYLHATPAQGVPLHRMALKQCTVWCIRNTLCCSLAKRESVVHPRDAASGWDPHCVSCWALVT